jgi:hypothetical protein
VLKVALTIFVFLLAFALLTIFTQIGGVVLLLAWLVSKFLKSRLSNRFLSFIFLPLAFIILYTLSTVAVVPWLAERTGRVALPWSGELRPLNRWTCILNRHYVRPDLKNLVEEATTKMLKKYPGRAVHYLDANFPFFDGFPLLPHLSHSDGRKLDLAFFYTDVLGNRVDGVPSSIGYGVFEGPQEGEENFPEKCSDKGFWQYGVLDKIVSQESRSLYVFDEKREKAFIQILVKDRRLEKLFIEPHLKSRMKLESSKIRYHGCQAVRHDDHVHIQIK